MELFCLGPLVVWCSLGTVMAIHGTIRWAMRAKTTSGEALAVPPGRGVNWFYAGVIVLSIVVPIVSVVYSEGRPRGSRPHGQFMVGLFLAGLLLFAIGHARSRAYHPRNTYWVPLIFVVFSVAIACLFILNFGSNFSV